MPSESSPFVEGENAFIPVDAYYAGGVFNLPHDKNPDPKQPIQIISFLKVSPTVQVGVVKAKWFDVALSTGEDGNVYLLHPHVVVPISDIGGSKLEAPLVLQAYAVIVRNPEGIIGLPFVRPLNTRIYTGLHPLKAQWPLED